MTKLAAAAVELPPLADVSAFSTTTSVARLALRDTTQTTTTMDTSSAAATESITASTSLGQLRHLPTVAPPPPHRSGQPPASIWSKDMTFSFGDILAAIEHFNDAYCIGKGSFGTVYRANLDGGRVVAVKRLDASETGDACCGS
uniref:non-specific serine/threonine protein kinase n=1 Tax=Oryza nivara TaxID=4536 RepID=A0A0E0IQX6_ORYNI